MIEKYPIGLAIAGFDPCGGAGLLQDMQAMQVTHVYATCVATAMTVQNTQKVYSWQARQADVIYQELNNLLLDVPIQACKIGMLGSLENVQTILTVLQKYSMSVPIVWDPILKATHGGSLFDGSFLEVIKILLPYISLLTPNLQELQQIAQILNLSKTKQEDIINVLLDLGVKAVLVKSREIIDNKIIDTLFTRSQDYDLLTPKIILDKEVHGTGCMLSSLIMAKLATGQTLLEAVIYAKSLVYQGIQHRKKIGQGKYSLVIEDAFVKNYHTYVEIIEK